MKAIRHTGIVITNLEKSLPFYRDVLGLKIQRDVMEQGEFIDRISGLKNVKVRTIKMSADAGNLVELLWYESYPRESEGAKEICTPGVSHLAFTVENIDYEYQRLKKRRIVFHCPPQISPDGKAKVTFCRDPEGNLIELVEML